MRPRFEAYGDYAGTTGVPRRFVYELAALARLACPFDPELTPGLRTDLAIHERAGVWRLKKRTVAAFLVALWCVLQPKP
jgi:hypothetical protein